jgi:CBS domain-containing protein
MAHRRGFKRRKLQVVTPQTQNGLAIPVLRSARTTLSVEIGTSLRQAADVIRQNGTLHVPVVRETVLVGLVTTGALRDALAAGADLDSPVDDWMTAPAMISAHESGAQALRWMEERGADYLWVVDERHVLMGVVGAADLFPRRRPLPRPPAVGGMATPFGVYLTTGAISSGPRKWALMATGASMIAILLVGQGLGIWASNQAQQWHLPGFLIEALASGLAILVFFTGFRLTPLAAIHAAEHQTVHAIERGEDLTLDIVRRMPRVHPRCGTNLFAGATIFLTVFSTEWVPLVEIRLAVAALLTAILWKRVGALMQSWVTTRPANDRYLAMGIRSGQELLERYTQGPVSAPTWPARIWNSGMLHTMAGAWIGSAIAYGFQFVTKIDLGLTLFTFAG